MAKQQPKTEVAVIENPLPTEMLEMAQKLGLVITDAQSIAVKFAPYMAVVNEYSQLIAKIEKVNPTESDAKQAREYRLKLVSNRGKNGMDITHTELKSGLVVRGRYIDSLYNAVENSSRLSELEAESIEKHRERAEAKRQEDLANTRRALLEPFETDTTYLPLGIMTDDQFTRLLENETLAQNARKDAAEKVELARIEAERLAEDARQEQLRLQAERIEAERLEAIRIKKELADKEVELVKEREAAKQAADKLAKENADKLAEQQRLAKIESDKQAAELLKQKQAADKLQAELQAKKDQEAKQLATKQAALLAPDKDKINQLYVALKNLEVPKFQTIEAATIGDYVKNQIAQLLEDIKFKSKKLK